ncbi:hypothetical protein EDC01DRAFT_381022 [Geopyxis carbonaria]|nr:hypothetical protein EDC01DRAFT_381022 [Geopyxis carbonaria]
MRSTGGVNVGALDRLGRAGVSVPGFEPVGRGTTMPPPPPRPSTLGDRLGGMALNSNSQPPSQGTTMEEKKAAAITANKFYKDPSSVSFKDARAAAGTARNFQQRHGDQVASGMKTANRLGLSAGILPPPTQREGPPSPPVRSAGPLPPVLGKRPPPPPPPKKKPALPTKGTPPPVPVSNRPPPVPMSSRPPPLSARPPPISPRPSACSTTPTALSNSGIPESEAPSMPLDLDLALPTQWYTHTPPRFPPCISTNSKKSMTYTTSWSTASSGRKTHTLTVAIRWTLNLSLTRLRITWDASAPAVTARASQRHFPPPQPPALNSLPLVGSAVARWCEARLGQCVGNGECWTLASEALKATPGAMASQGYTHGACVYTHTAPAAAVSAGEIQVGDVLQFWKARWEWGNGAWKSAGDPDHTAVVTGVRVKDAGAGGGPEVEVVEQNVGGVKTVVRGTYELGEGKMVQGRCRVFRAVGEDWAPLEATWDD